MRALLLLSASLSVVIGGSASAGPKRKPKATEEKARTDDGAARPKGVRRLSPSLSVDLDRRRVTIDAEVVLREGPLELLLCPRRTKEHESILAADAPPKLVQLALILAGAKPGRPASFDPYRPPTGQPIDIRLEFEQGGQTRSIDARRWIRDAENGKEIGADFVFAGSGFRKVPGIEEPVFLGDQGDLICLVNFPGSVIDVGIESSKENASRLFEAWTERIPDKRTKVRIILEPVFEKKKVDSTP